MLLIGATTFLVAMGVTCIATPLVVRLANSLGAVDRPAARKLHRQPVPRLGGLPLFLGFLVGLAFAAAVTGKLSAVPESIYWNGLVVAVGFLFLVGLADDLWQVSFRWKFVAQTAAAVLIWFSGFRIELLTNPLGGALELGWLSFPLTVLWVVGITNAVNLIDGLDGLAAGAAVIMTGALAVISAFRMELGVTAATVALAGALVGFLWFNFNPARIFLGDSGSMVIGFVLAVTSVRASQKGPAVVAIFVPLLVLGLPLLDTGFAVFRRALRLGDSSLKSGNAWRYVWRNVDQMFLPDRGHIHHRLLDLGLSHRNAVLTLYGVVALMVGAAFALVLLKNLWVALLLLAVLVLLLAAFFGLLLQHSWRLNRRDQEANHVVHRADMLRASSGNRLESR